MAPTNDFFPAPEVFMDGYGSILCFLPNQTGWVSSNGRQLFIWKDEQLLIYQAPNTYLIDHLLVHPSQPVILAGPYRFNWQTESWSEPPPISQLIHHGVQEQFDGQFVLKGTRWDVEGSNLLLYASFQPSRRAKGSASVIIPSDRLLLWSDAHKTIRQVVWEGDLMLGIKSMVLTGDLMLAAGKELHAWLEVEGAFHPLPNLKPFGRSGHTFIHQVAWDGSRQYLGQYGSNGHITIWMWKDQSLQQLASWSGHQPGMGNLAFHPQQPFLLSGGEDGRLCLWDLQGNLVASHQAAAPFAGLAVSHNGDQVLVAQSGKAPQLQLFFLP